MKFPGDELAVKREDKRGVILLSGGIDSTVTLEGAVRNGWELVAWVGCASYALEGACFRVVAEFTCWCRFFSW